MAGTYRRRSCCEYAISIFRCCGRRKEKVEPSCNDADALDRCSIVVAGQSSDEHVKQTPSGTNSQPTVGHTSSGRVLKHSMTYSRGSFTTLNSTWMQSQEGRPKRLILVRHGESQGNVDRLITRTVPDPKLHLTIEGRRQALDAGERLKKIIGNESLRFIVSPYIRAKETCNGICQAFGGIQEDFKIVEEPRIREIEYGNYDREDIKDLHKQKATYGAFFYRFPEGESPADVYDRASSFLETLYRMWNQKHEDNYVVVGHGIMLLVFVQRFFGMTVDEYYQLERLDNCEFIVFEKNKYNWYDKLWSMRAGEPPHEGLRRKNTPVQDHDIWDGTMMEAEPVEPIYGSLN